MRNAADIDRLIEARGDGNRPVGGLLATEGSHPLEGRLENVEKLYAAGYRMMGLTHFFDNELGGSLHGLSGEGLTDFGREAVREMERLNIIVDLAHASPAVVRDTLDIATRPVVVSHDRHPLAPCDSPRNLEDALMKRIADAGGLVGIGYWKGAVCDPAPAEIVKSIRYAIDFLGVDHVALGSDYDGASAGRFRHVATRHTDGGNAESGFHGRGNRQGHGRQCNPLLPRAVAAGVSPAEYTSNKEITPYIRSAGGFPSGYGDKRTVK